MDPSLPSRPREGKEERESSGKRAGRQEEGASLARSRRGTDRRLKGRPGGGRCGWKRPGSPRAHPTRMERGIFLFGSWRVVVFFFPPVFPARGENKFATKLSRPSPLPLPNRFPRSFRPAYPSILLAATHVTKYVEEGREERKDAGVFLKGPERPPTTVARVSQLSRVGVAILLFLYMRRVKSR